MSTIEDAVSFAVSRLLQVPDASDRYEAAAQLRDRIPWVQATSASQLAQEHPRGMSGAAEQLGVTRQYLDRIIREHDQPSPRRRRSGPDEEAPPTYHYGWAQGVFCALADQADNCRPSGHYRDQYDRIMQTGYARPAMLSRSYELARRCLRVLPDNEVDQWQHEIDEALSRVPADLPADLQMSQQWYVVLGMHHAMARIAPSHPSHPSPRQPEPQQP